MAKSWDWAM